MEALLRHRMAPGGRVNLIERLAAIMESEFGALLSIRTRLIPKVMARWLLKHHDPWDTSLNLPNGKFLIYDEDVHVTLELPMGSYQIQNLKIAENDTAYIKFLKEWRIRTGCKAFIQFHIDEDGKWLAPQHEIEYNHPLRSPNKQHLLPSHRQVSEDDILFVKQLRESGIGIADTCCVLKKQVGGSPCLCYGLRDVYNKIAQFECRRFDGGDAKSLIEIFNRRLKYEHNFYFAFELDVNNCLVNFFCVISEY